MSKLLNEGAIRLAGGTITQQEVLPTLYQSFSSGNAITTVTPLGIRALSDIFSVNDDGTISQNAASTYSSSLTNAQLAGAGDTINQHPIYFLGTLDADQGVVLAPGSVTDLSGTSIRNPYAVDPQTGAPIAAGRIVAGGTLATDPRAALPGQTLFRAQTGSTYSVLVAGTGANTAALNASQSGRDLVIDPGATLDLAGASDVYDLPAASDSASMTVSNLMPHAGLEFGRHVVGRGRRNADRRHHPGPGRCAAAEGGTLVLLDPVLTQHDPATPTGNLVSADMIEDSGFDTLVAIGSVNSNGDATLALGRGFFLASRLDTQDGSIILASSGNGPASDTLLPTVKAGGRLEIDAPYVGLVSNVDGISNPLQGATGSGSVVFNADAIDITVRSCSTSRSPARRSTPAATFA